MTDKKEISSAQAGQAAYLEAKMLIQYNDDRDMVNQIGAQGQILIATGKFLQVGGLLKLKYIKENKLYKHLKGSQGVDKAGQIIADRGNWDGFCKSLGLSRSKVDEDILNLNELGEQAMEMIGHTGLGYREMRVLRKLPETKQEELKELVAVNDKAGLVEFVEDVMTEQVKLKEALEDSKADTQRDEALLEKKDKKINTLNKELDKRSIDLGKWDENVAELQLKIAGVSTEIKEAQAKLASLVDFIPQIDMPQEHQDKIIELLGMSYWNASNEAFIDASDTMAVADQLYGGYAGKGRAIPLLEDVLADETTNSDEKIT